MAHRTRLWQHTTHRAAFLRSIGLDPSLVVDASFGTAGCTVMGEFPDLGEVRYEFDVPPMTRVLFGADERKRAAAAMAADMREYLDANDYLPA